ncbi:MAG: VanZ family protein [Thermoanaerobaculia bacterium]|nr:VanZ family protein [Thermoanaerobaculia bacterium]
MKLHLRSSAARTWVLVGIYVAVLFASVPFARDIVVGLREQHLLGTSVTLLYFAAVVGLVYHVVFDVRLSDRIAFLALVLLALVTGSLVLGLAVPEERIHFLQYGLLALLCRRALAWHFEPRGQVLGAVALASVAGVLDEVLQGVTPDRVCDARDMMINSVAAFLAIVAEEALHNRLGWLPGKEGDEPNPGD